MMNSFKDLEEHCPLPLCAAAKIITSRRSIQGSMAASAQVRRRTCNGSEPKPIALETDIPTSAVGGRPHPGAASFSGTGSRNASRKVPLYFELAPQSASFLAVRIRHLVAKSHGGGWRAIRCASFLITDAQARNRLIHFAGCEQAALKIRATRRRFRRQTFPRRTARAARSGREPS
jgi:hypothetical protein